MRNVNEVPNEYLCPITLEIMKNPVIAKDGYSYEEEAIKKWFEHRNISPKTGIALSDKTLLPNYTLRSAIQDFVENSKNPHKSDTRLEKTDIEKRTKQRQEKKSEHADFKMAGLMQWNEADGLAVDSRVRISELEYNCDQLTDWCNIKDKKNEVLLSQLEEVLVQEEKLRQKIFQQTHSKEDIANLEKSLHQINNKLTNDPKNEKFINTKAKLLRQLQRTREALKILNDAIQGNPKNIYLLNTRGTIYVDMGQIKLAAQDFLKILSIDPENSYGLHGKKLVAEKIKANPPTITSPPVHQLEKRTDSIEKKSSEKINAQLVKEPRHESMAAPAVNVQSARHERTSFTLQQSEARHIMNPFFLNVQTTVQKTSQSSRVSVQSSHGAATSAQQRQVPQQRSNAVPSKAHTEFSRPASSQAGVGVTKVKPIQVQLPPVRSFKV